MTNLDERVYFSEEQFIPILTVAVDDRQNFSMMMATSSRKTITGLGADGTSWMALGPGRDSGHAASGNQMSYFKYHVLMLWQRRFRIL